MRLRKGTGARVRGSVLRRSGKEGEPKNYESEQSELKEKAKRLQESVQIEKTTEENLSKFIRLVKRYTEIPELTAEILNAFIDRIYVGEKVKGVSPTGKRNWRYKSTRAIKIIYKFVGAVNLQ